jgi:flagellar M-ring protein FliF
MDMSPKTVKAEEFQPFVVTPRTPGSPYDDSKLQDGVTRSESTSVTEWEGTGFNPEGPPGVEGQTPPAFRDMSNLVGKVKQETRTTNRELNKRETQEEVHPQIDKKTVSVNIDGTWKLKYDEKGKPVMQPDGTREREYVPVAPEDLRNVQALIQGAIGFDAAKGDLVTVTSIPYDRNMDFIALDTAYLRQKNIQLMVVILLSGLAALLIAFVIFRMVSRELERRRRLREEEISRQQQAMRESALLDAENEGVEVSMSVEEKRRMELQENALTMAKEHPGDVAQLIRTWLLEE